MDNENNPVADIGHPSIASIWKESVADGLKVIKSTEIVTGRPRHIVDAALLGTCIVFFAAMLGLPQKQIDGTLTNALIAFAVAIPLLTSGYLDAFYKVKHDVRGWRILEAILTGSAIAETLGEIAVFVGVYEVIAHLSILALNAFIAAFVLAVVGVPLLSFVGLFIYALVLAWRSEKQKAKLSQSTEQETSSVDQSTNTATTNRNPTMVELPPQAPNS